MTSGRKLDCNITKVIKALGNPDQGSRILPDAQRHLGKTARRLCRKTSSASSKRSKKRGQSQSSQAPLDSFGNRDDVLALYGVSEKRAPLVDLESCSSAEHIVSSGEEIDSCASSRTVDSKCDDEEHPCVVPLADIGSPVETFQVPQHPNHLNTLINWSIVHGAWSPDTSLMDPTLKPR